MIILNRGNIFSDKQIQKVIKYLGYDYKPWKIVIYETRFDMLRYFFSCFNFALEELLGKLEGSYNQETDTVFIFVFAQNDDGDDLHSKQLYSLHALAHELRHRYQLVNNLFTGESDEDASERDADLFATDFINTKAKKVSRIMGWKSEWQIEEID
ncbi:MAG: hypothetical protein ACYDEQ_08475 [Desulfocucumaceae bacterium]